MTGPSLGLVKVPIPLVPWGGALLFAATAVPPAALCPSFGARWNPSACGTLPALPRASQKPPPVPVGAPV